MSLYCPKCWAPAKCIESRCDERTNSVRRRYSCASCKFRFSSIEILPDHLDLRADDKSLLVRTMKRLLATFIDADKRYTRRLIDELSEELRRGKDATSK